MGGVGDFLMVTALMAFFVASANSKFDPHYTSGPISVLYGALHPNWDMSSVLAGVFLLWITVGAIFYSLFDAGRAGSVCYTSSKCKFIKESQPFSKSRGYGKWQAFYYAFFLVMFWSCTYNLLIAVYAAAPVSFPDNFLSAWSFELGHSAAITHYLNRFSTTSYLFGALTWALRAYPKSFLIRLGVLKIRHWYVETADEEAAAEALAEMAERHAAYAY